jgi:hypothetical protein
MDLTTFNILNNILHPHFHLVDNPDNNKLITHFEEINDRNRLSFWKLRTINNKLIGKKTQNKLLEIVKELKLGDAELCSINGIGKYLVLFC